MGYIYKLKPKIKKFILEQKKGNPNLSCRNLATLVLEKFQLDLSKSSINLIIKSAGMSMPIGRRRCKKRRAAAASATQPVQETRLLSAPAAAAGPKEGPLKPIPVEKGPQTPLPKPSEGPKPAIELPKPAEAPKPVEEPGPTQTPRPPIQKPAPAEELEVEAECTGAILLKAMDALIGGSRFIVAELKKQLPQEPDLLSKTEALIYLPLFQSAGPKHIKVFPPLCSLVDKEVFLEDLLSYLTLLQSIRTKGPELLGGILNLLRQVRGIKIILVGGREIYLDAQFHTVWPTRLSPHTLSTTIYIIKSYINKCFFRDQPLVLFMAPGSEPPGEEFFNFILGLNSQTAVISRLDIFGHKFDSLQIIQIEENKRRFFIFGLWPSQYVDYRSIKKAGEFKPFRFEPLKREFLLAEAEITLSQPNINQSVTLKGCILKDPVSQRPILVILANLADIEIEKLAGTYLSHWPNLEEGLHDFSRKEELFSYLGDSQGPFSTGNLGIDDPPADIKAFFSSYLAILDLYFRWYFLSDEFKDKDFPTTKGIFYDLKAILRKQKDRILVTFRPPMGFPFRKELEYACRRLNEREIEFSDGRRLWFVV